MDRILPRAMVLSLTGQHREMYLMANPVMNCITGPVKHVSAVGVL